jgi:hypothetical protein
MEKLNANDMCIHENGYIGLGNDGQIVKAETWRTNIGELHRDGDQPAIITEDGDMYWYWSGELHRSGDQPAVIKSGVQEWWVDGSRHRDGDQPAIITEDGARFYCKDSKLHRDARDSDGLLLPAIVNNYHQLYYLNGQLVDREGNIN